MRRPAALDSRVRSLEGRGNALPREMVATVSTGQNSAYGRLRSVPARAPRCTRRIRPDAMSAPPSIETLKSELLEDLRRHSPKVDLSRAAEAFDYSRAAHGEQLRKSGVPYVSHPVATVHILVDLLDSHLDTAIACAALLHDTVEDTHITLADVRERYGDEVTQLVDGVTKISGFTFDSAKSEQAENFRKMLLSMARDLRVIFIKLADRLHNMRTLEFLPPDKAQRIARETRDIYAPLAHRLGIARIKRELEDLALKTLDPPAYRELAEKVALRREHREGMLKRLEEPLLTRLAAAGLTADVATRPKHFYSIYQKMKSSGRSFDQIFDLLGLRIVTVDKGDCYRALGVVHDLWIPVQDRFKDYIATPKTNLYQSLHTTVVVPGGEMVEIQIRTRDMHRTAESGVAAHYVYKGGQLDLELDARLGGFVGQTADWQATASDEEYMEFLHTALYQDEVFVYTPRRELKRLPKGATPLDFAFLVHWRSGSTAWARASTARSCRCATRSPTATRSRSSPRRRRARTPTGSRSCARRRRARRSATGSGPSTARTRCRWARRCWSASSSGNAWPTGSTTPRSSTRRRARA